MPNRVSIALCTYNGAAYLPAQLDSIARQTRPPDELVVCDDQSTDGTPELLRAFASTARLPVRVIANESRLGSTANFEKAIGLCEGDLILLSDQDDVWLETKIERVAAAMEEHPEFGALFTDAVMCDAALRPLGYTLWEAIGFTPAEQARVAGGNAFEVLMKHNVVTGATMAIRAEQRKLIFPIPAVDRCVHDHWAACLIAATGKLGMLPGAMIQYRLHPTSQIGRPKMSLREQASVARRQVRENTAAKDLAVYSALRERLMAAGGRDTDLRLLDGKINHLRVRAALPSGLFMRLPAIWRECRQGRYRAFSYGWKSAMQDAFLR